MVRSPWEEEWSKRSWAPQDAIGTQDYPAGGAAVGGPAAPRAMQPLHKQQNPLLYVGPPEAEAEMECGGQDVY